MVELLAVVYKVRGNSKKVVVPNAKYKTVFHVIMVIITIVINVKITLLDL